MKGEKINTFKKLDVQSQKQIYGGGFFAALLALIPIITSAVISIIGAFKVSQSSSGEIKTKEISQKFENKNEDISTHAQGSKNPPIYFVY